MSSLQLLRVNSNRIVAGTVQNWHAIENHDRILLFVMLGQSALASYDKKDIIK